MDSGQSFKNLFQQLSVNQFKDIIQLYDFDLKITFT